MNDWPFDSQYLPARQEVVCGSGGGESRRGGGEQGGERSEKLQRRSITGTTAAAVAVAVAAVAVAVQGGLARQQDW